MHVMRTFEVIRRLTCCEQHSEPLLNMDDLHITKDARQEIKHEK